MAKAFADIDIIEQERAPLDDFTSLDFRRKLIDPEASFDDIAVLCGLLVAGRVSSDTARQPLQETGAAVGTLMHDFVASGQIATEDWDLLHQLWYRWKIPLGATALSWWYLFCVALKKAKEVEAACDLFQIWLDQIEDAEIRERPGVYSNLTGIDTGRGAVVLRDDVFNLPYFVTAAMRGLPVFSLWSEADLPLLEKALDGVVLTDLSGAGDSHDPAMLPRWGLEATRGVANMRMLCLGRNPHVGGVMDDVRRFWGNMSPEERSYVLVHLEQRIAALEIVRLSYGNEVFENEAIAKVLETCRSDNPETWTPLQLGIAAIAWAWQQSGFVLQELNQSEVNLASFRVFLERRIGEYERVTGRRVPVGLCFADLVSNLAELRALAERTHMRCLYFDGGNWERREFLVSRADCDKAQSLPPDLVSFMQDRFGRPMPDADASEVWRLYLHDLLEHSHTPSELMIALAEWVANAEDLPVDYATFDVPMGVNLENPWQIGLDEIFCYTAFRKGFEIGDADIPLNLVGVQNAIGQRMRYNAVKKAQNYALMKRMTPQVFLLPDISVAEDAHHGGHYATGLRHTCRIPISISYCGSAWKGIADVRLNRAKYSDVYRFREDDLVLATRYGVWAKAIAAEAYKANILFDRRFCSNLEDGRDVAAKLGRA